MAHDLAHDSALSEQFNPPPLIGTSYVNARRDQFVIGQGTIDVTAHEAAIIEKLMRIDFLHRGFEMADMMRSLCYQNEEKFLQRYNDLMTKLMEHPIANLGGNGSVFYEDTITARDLFEERDGYFRFKKELAVLIKGDNILSDEQLHRINFVPSWYKPTGLVM